MEWVVTVCLKSRSVLLQGINWSATLSIVFSFATFCFTCILRSILGDSVIIKLNKQALVLPHSHYNEPSVGREGRSGRQEME